MFPNNYCWILVINNNILGVYMSEESALHEAKSTLSYYLRDANDFKIKGWEQEKTITLSRKLPKVKIIRRLIEA